MHKHFKTYIITFFVLVAGVVSAGLISRITTFTDGEVLFASDLNGEFNQLVNLVNGNLDNDNISASASISPVKISGTIAGDGLDRNGSTGALSVNDDDSTLTITADTLLVKTNGIGNGQIRQSSGLSVVGRSANSTGNVADIIAANDAEVLRRSGTSIGFGTIATAGIADGAVTNAKLATFNSGVSSSSGEFASGSATLVQVTNMSVTLTTTGRPVMLTMISADTSDLSGSPAATNGLTECSRSPVAEADCQIAYTDSSTILSEYSMRSGNLNSGSSAANTVNPCSAYMYFGTPSAGSHTFLVKVRRSSANTQAIIHSCKLVAYEL